MRMVIEISDDFYNKTIECGRLCYEYMGTVELVDAIKNGTVLPDKLTNGAVICLLYPNLRYVIQNGRVVTTIGVASSFDLDWWNAPYKEDGKI